MKNIFKFSLACLVAVLTLTGCSKAEEGLIKVTHYATFTLTDGELTKVPVGSAYKDPGCVCMEGENDITSTVKVEGTDIDTSAPGIWGVNYSAVNVDGFSSSASRTVIVYDPNSISRDLSGTYTVTGNSFRDRSGAKTAFSGYEISVEKVAEGIYYISDYLGGYYDQRAGYGSSYACTGYFWLDNNNVIHFLTANVAGWGDSAELDSEALLTVDNTLYFKTKYAGMTFYVELAK